MTQLILADYYQQETERLRLRKMTKEDLKTWTNFFINNSGEKYLGIDMSLPPSTKAKNWIDLQLKRYAVNNFGHLAAIEKSTGDLIGVGGLIERKLNGKIEYEVAYSIIPKYWSNGYATEIAKQMKQFAIKHELHDSLISMIDIGNMASKNVATKNGMENSGTMEYQGLQVNIFRVSIA